MRTFRKKLRQLVIGALPAAALACSSGYAGSSSTSGTGTGSGTSGSGASSASSGCSPCGCTPPPDPHAFVPPFDGGFADGGPIAVALCLGPCTLDGTGASFVLGCSAIGLPDGGPDWDVTCHDAHICAGRRPEGLCEPKLDGRTALGAHFARMAHLEAASVPAFRRMAHELQQHQAPASLVRAAQRAARDEVRHARMMGRRAQAHGCVVPPVRHARHVPRGLEAFARENAVEGCVRETFGAAVALVQARRAREPVLRAELAAIAEDELRHAELAHRTHAWLEPRLSLTAQRRIARARDDAFAALGALPAAEGPSARELGLPDAPTVKAILAGLQRGLA